MAQYIGLCHVVVRATEGASGSKGRSRKSPIFLWIPLSPPSDLSFPSQTLMSKKDGVLVQIYDHQFRLGSDSRDSEYIQKAATFLDGKMRRAAQEAGKRSPFELAIIAAMEIAEEVLEERTKTEHMLNKADERLNSFSERLESQSGSADSVGPEKPDTESDPILQKTPSSEKKRRF